MGERNSTWLVNIAETGYTLELAPGDDGIIETPSEDEEGGEDLMVEIWMSAEEDEMEERGMVDRSSRNDLADDDEDMADEGDIYE